MQKTPFAGLTMLDPDESILDDAGSFIGRDREIIDRLLQIGAKLHRHNAAPGLENPNQPMGASAVASAGTMPGALSFSVGYTLEDGQNGETLISPLVTLSTPPVIETPLLAPDVTIDYTAGDLTTDTYYYAYAFIDDEGGETPIGPSTAGEREPGFPNARATISDLQAGLAAAGAYGWRLYRAVGGGDFHYLASGIGDTYIDDGSVSVNCDIEPLESNVNTTNSSNSLLLRLPSADARVSDADFINVYLSEDGSFSGNTFLQQFPVSSAGQMTFWPSVTLVAGQPPDTNQSIGGASMIDPDEELLDWHWKRPVASAGALPGDAEEGDVRIALDTGNPWKFIGGSWAPWLITGSAQIDVNDADGPDVTVTTELQFRASGIAQVGVTNPGGIPRVTIFVPSAAVASGGGGGTALRVTDFSTIVDDVAEIDFLNGVVTDLGGGAVQVEIPPPRRDRGIIGTVTTGALASGASGAAVIGLNAGYRLLAIETDAACRVRLYGTVADQVADAARPIHTDPTGDHGVMLDFLKLSAGLERINPIVEGANFDNPTTPDIPITVDLMDPDTAVTVSLHWVPTELFGG